jgi:hypothetical protein
LFNNKPEAEANFYQPPPDDECTWKGEVVSAAACVASLFSFPVCLLSWKKLLSHPLIPILIITSFYSGFVCDSFSWGINALRARVWHSYTCVNSFGGFSFIFLFFLFFITKHDHHNIYMTNDLTYNK